jgi:hypothetical protein
MEESEKYYSKTDKEVLSLVAWHAEQLAARKQMHKVAPGDAAIAKMLEQVKEQIRLRAAGRLQEELVLKKNEESELAARSKAICPACKEMRQTTIIAVDVDERYGWKTDELQCTVCSTVFMHPLPNNRKDRIEYLETIQDHIDALEAAITAWGPPEARGGRAEHDTLKTAAKVVKADLKQLASYAQATKPNDPDSWRRLKFGIKRPKSAPTRLQAVRDLRIFVSRDVVGGTIKLKWVRPLDSDPGDVKCYIIQFSDRPEQPLIKGSRAIVNVWAVITDTSIILEPPFVGANYFWVTPCNSVGYGVSSDPLFYNAPGKIVP